MHCLKIRGIFETYLNLKKKNHLEHLGIKGAFKEKNTAEIMGFMCIYIA